jgi:hypothetical protein
MKPVSKPLIYRYLRFGPMGTWCPRCRSDRDTLRVRAGAGEDDMHLSCITCAWRLHYRIDVHDFRQVIK